MIHADDSDALQVGPDPDKLYLYHRQQLSAMLDGELSPDQARFMLRRLQHDAELADCWERWQVCGDVLRGQRNALLPADFAQGVARAISAGGAVMEAPAAVARPRLWRWGGGAALAASVAMAALFVAREPLQAPAESPSQTVSPAVAASPTNEPAADVAVGTEQVPAQAPDVALVLAGTVLAAAEVPRRADERRARGQSQRAAVTRVQRNAQTPVAVAAAAAPAPRPAIADLRALPEPPAAADDRAGDRPADRLFAAGAATEAVDPFGLSPAAPSRPWPRAVLAGGGDRSLAAGYGTPSSAPFSFHPFEPRVEADAGSVSQLLPPVTAIGADAQPAGTPNAEGAPPDPR